MRFPASVLQKQQHMNDRTSKLLLALIAVALWAFLLRPLWEPATAKAQADKTNRTQYEYWFDVSYDSDDGKSLLNNLNKWGKEGCRVVNFAFYYRGERSTPQTVVLVERRIDAP